MSKRLRKLADRGAAEDAPLLDDLAFRARFLKSEIGSGGKRLAAARQRVMLERFLEQHGPGENEMAVACYGQIGDAYMLSRYAKAAKKQHGLERIVFYARPKHAFIPRLFKGVDAVVDIPADVPAHLLFDGSVGGQHSKHPRIVGQSLALMWAMGYGGLLHDDVTKISLGLPQTTQPEDAVKPSKPEMDSAEEKLRRLNLKPGRTALLIPGAVSTAGRAEPSVDWAGLCSQLCELGWAVVANEGPEGRLIPAIPSVRFALEDLRPAAAASGLVVSNRCGLTDLLSDLPVAHIAFYPSIQWCLGKLVDVHGLKANRLAENALEIVLGEAAQTEKIRAFLQQAVRV